MANEASPCPCDIGHRLEYGGMGREVQVEHIRAYVTRPPADTGKAVIVVQDIFGWELPNTRYMADLIAGNGYTTIVPDFFVGKEPWSPSADMKTFPEWFKSRDARKVDKEVDAVLRYLTQQCGAQKVGIVGFCWGGIVVHHVMTKYRQIRAGVSVYGLSADPEIEATLQGGSSSEDFHGADPRLCAPQEGRLPAGRQALHRRGPQEPGGVAAQVRVAAGGLTPHSCFVPTDRKCLAHLVLLKKI
ncbi:carboxymethylenebutenolidase homolog isoform X2 [Fukomys damarensis]|uniref:carboxymethylenebutenolidase homolog isoform X2 n=1 Tax=Fukomys damarensis TaxID=885580 RepID=UPI00053FB6CD|nr:carboxymethylenebutenolidase homolog isoform X2 [Fukomys damarensis]